MTVIKINRWDSQKERLAALQPDMAEQPYTQATPKDASVILPAILAGLVAVAVIAGVKFQLWTYFEGVFK